MHMTAIKISRPYGDVSEMSFCAWLAQDEPSEALTYHRGFLVVDTDPVSRSCPTVNASPHAPLPALRFALRRRASSISSSSAWRLTASPVSPSHAPNPHRLAPPLLCGCSRPPNLSFPNRRPS